MSDEAAPGDSTEQREAEALLIKGLIQELGIELRKRKFALPEGGWLEVDGVSENPAVLGEAWAHIGPPKSAQKAKVAADVIKLLYADTFVPKARKFLVFADASAAAFFQGRSWLAQAIKGNGVEIRVIELPSSVRESVLKAQARQFR